MGPISTGLISNLIANSFWSILRVIGWKQKEVKRQKKELKRLLERDVSAKVILQRAATQAAKCDSSRIEKMQLFLGSPEVEAIMRQMYSTQLKGKSKYKNLNAAFNEFKECLQLHLGRRKENIESFARELFENLKNCCERALQIAVDNGILSAHELRSVMRHKILIDEISTIQKNIKFLLRVETASLPIIYEFEEKYRQEVGRRHSYIVPPHFDSARKFKIGRLYIEPEIVRIAFRRGEEDTSLAMEDFLSEVYRVVVLGNPGSGKSTLAFKICKDLATGYSKRMLGGRRLTPVIVTLREYGAVKKQKNSSILEFIEEKANSTYQCKAPPGAFEYMILNGHVVVIFDGLDELLDTSYRQQISGDIESFCNIYPSVPVIVTSRKVGYEQAPLDRQIFKIYWIAEFDEVRARQYAKKWFTLEEDYTEDERKEKVEAFMRESSIVPDLRGNPLMLALMCSIYRGEGYIPRNRPDLYEKCAVMLFERWDKSRGIHIALPFEAHIRPTIMYLAKWIYSDEKLQGGVTEESLVTKATEYLWPRRFEDRNIAEKSARDFVEFCRGRAWVFTDTGTTKAGERIYQFTHRTFTAAYIVRTHSTSERLQKLLLPRIRRREWDIVSQLACQLLNKNVEGGGDELLSGFIREGKKEGGKSYANLISFAGRCLEFIVPSPKVARDVSSVCVEKSLEGPEPEELLSCILRGTRENRIPIRKGIEDVLMKKINDENETTSTIAAEIALNLNIALWTPRRIESKETREFWMSFSDEFLETYFDKIIYLSRKCVTLSLQCLYRGKIRLAEFVEWHGVNSIFKSHAYKGFRRIFTGPPIRWLMYFVFSQKDDPKNLKLALSYLAEVGNILISYKTPWKQMSKHQHIPGDIDISKVIEFQNWESAKVLKLNSHKIFGYFVIVAMAIEEESIEVKNLNNILKRLKAPTMNQIHWTWIARFEQVQEDKVQAVLDACRFTNEQQKFVWKWIRKEINLIGNKRANGKNK